MGLFNMRLIAGEIEKELLENFERTRKDLKNKSVKYQYMFGSKSSTIRIFAKIFVKFNPEFMELVEKLEEKNDN